MPAKKQPDAVTSSEPQAKQGTRSRRGTRRLYIEIGLDEEQINHCKEIAASCGFTTVSEGARLIIDEHKAGTPGVQRLKSELMKDEDFRAEVAADVIGKLLTSLLEKGPKMLDRQKEGDKEEA